MINSPSFWDKLKEELRAVTKEVRSFTTDVDNTIRVALHTGKTLTFNLSKDVSDEEAISAVKEGVLDSLELPPSPEIPVTVIEPVDTIPEVPVEPDLVPDAQPATSVQPPA